MTIFNRIPRFGGHVIETTGLRDGVVPPSTSLTPPRSYADARTDAVMACRAVGVDLDEQYTPNLSAADLVMLAFAAGSKAGEARLAAPDIADAIAGAIATPGGILERESGESESRHVVRAVQQVIAYGVPK